MAAPAALAAAPALSQQAPATTSPPTVSTRPAVVRTGALEMTHGGWRSSQIVGAPIYDGKGNTIGTVSDLIVDQNGKISQAILSVGGFLGIGSKLVSIPYGQLQFQQHTETAARNGVGTVNGNTNTNGSGAAVVSSGGLAPPAGPPAAPTPPANGGNAAVPATTTTTAGAPAVVRKTTRIVLPGATQDSLKAMPTFSYTAG